jgi:hypothetical protein
MPINNFSSIGGYAVAATEVLSTERALKNISAMHMTSDSFTDANKDTFLLKRVTDASNNTMQLSLDGTTPLASNSIPLGQNSVAFVRAHVFGQETTSSQYVHASTYDVVIHTASGSPVVSASHENILRNNPPGQESWSVTPDAFTIGSDPFFTFEVATVTTSSTVKWIGVLDITLVT